MQNLGLFKLLLFCILEVRSIYGEPIVLPTSSGTLASYSIINATSTCSNSDGTFSCNSACPNRNTFPQSQAPLKSLPTHCHRSDSNPINAAVNTANGTVNFNSTTSDCIIEENVNSGSNKYFTLTVWIKVSCRSDCEILSIDTNGLQLKYTTSGSKFVLGTRQSSVSITPGLWYLLVIRYNGALSWFINDAKQMDALFTELATHALKLGPKSNLTNADTISMVDARWYSDSLTDREVTSMKTGNLENIILKSDCRCPVTFPKLVQNTLPVKYMKCTNGNTQVLRLGTDIHLPEYMIDNDASTSWISERENSMQITLTLKKQFQIKRISFDGIKNKPTSLQVSLYIGTKESLVLNFKASCSGSDETCAVLDTHLSGETFSYDFEPDSISKRSVYQRLIADKIVVQAMYSTSNYFTVSELKLQARCNCFGQDNGCSISKGNYGCTCDSSSKTTHTYCDVCVNEYYRKNEDFKCGFPCGCNTTGRVDNICDKVGGQCSCKDNIGGRQCTKCKHNFAKFSSSGCTACPCNPEGITTCSDTLVCACKQNVEMSTGNCTMCLPNYYNITNSSGCTFCGCDTSGTKDTKPNCDNNTGECYCRNNVQGKKCDACKDTYFGLSADNELGCENCSCNIVGSSSLTCDKGTGQCPCVDGNNHTDDGNRQCIPQELKLEPNFGPKVGGTVLTLTGTLLGTNTQVALTLDGEQQHIVSRNLTFIVFKTKPNTEGAKSLSLTWTYQGKTYRDDGLERETPSFTYRKNPQIISPTKPIRSYASGGCTLRLLGSNLDSVAHPKMQVYLKNGLKAESLCIPEAAGLNCPTPEVGKDESNMTLSYGFRMDGVKKYENVSKEYGTMLVIVPDPVVYIGMSETFKNTFDKTFRIKGERLHDACHDSDVTITLGDKNCALLNRADHSITCDPGETFPGTARTVQVKVKIGNKEWIWGELTINSFWTNTEFIGIAVGAGAFLIIIIVIVVCIIRCRRRNSFSGNRSDDSIPLEIPTTTVKTVPNDYSRINPVGPVAVIQPQQSPEETRTPKEIAEAFCKRLKKNVGKVVNSSLIERGNIELGKVCTHKGKKIRVISGQYNASTSSPYSGSSLTIKTLLESYSEEGGLPDWLNNNLLECTRLQDYENDNVLRMKGIAVDAKNLYIIYPEMSNKTLKDYLLGTKEPLTTEKRLEICIQVAEGMNYLSTQSVVHKDLAARNCWVSRDFEVKIGDASFSFDLYPKDYLESNGRYQPVRWMAPESLRQGFYDSKSDVWAYGVLVWEVFTNGYMPYFDIRNNADVKQRVCDDQYRLGKPHECSDEVFHIIQECHKESSEDRPNFFIVQNMLDSIINPAPAHPNYANQQELAQAEDGMEDYENIRIKPPPRPPKGRKT